MGRRITGKDYVGHVPGEAPSSGHVGMKWDSGKRRFSLLAWDAIGSLVDVLEYGAHKYAESNWLDVMAEEPGPRPRRYFDAAIRHLTAWWQGEESDPETGLPHTAHAMACCMFLLAHDLRKRGQR